MILDYRRAKKRAGSDLGKPKKVSLNHNLYCIRIQSSYTTFAYTYYKSKFYPKAEDAIRKAMKIDPDNQNYKDQLVEIQRAIDAAR